MRIEVIRADGDLKREVWVFTLLLGWGGDNLYLNAYSFQTRVSRRHKNWRKQTHWARLEHRDNNIDQAPLSIDVEAEMRIRYQEYITTLPIEK